MAEPEGRNAGPNDVARVVKGPVVLKIQRCTGAAVNKYRGSDRIRKYPERVVAGGNEFEVSGDYERISS